MSWSIPHEPTRTARAAEVSQQGQCDVVRDALGSAPVLVVLGGSGELSRVTMAVPTIDTEAEPREVLLGHVIPSTLVHTATGTPTSVEVRNGADVILRGSAGTSGALVNFAGPVKARCAPSVGIGGIAVRADSGLPATPQPDAALDLIATAHAAGQMWVRLDNGVDTFQEAWPESEYRDTNAGYTPIIYAWGGMAWDNDHHRLIFDGSGHANASSNEVFTWSAITRGHELAYYGSEHINVNPGPNTHRVKGFNDAPTASHPYCNRGWLTVLQRYLSLGGASWNDGGPLRVFDESISGDQPGLRIAGAYTLDMTLAGQGYTAGGTGTNGGTSLPGAEAWQLRDWLDSGHASQPIFGGNTYATHQDRGLVTTVEDGVDVAYYTAGSNFGLVRTEFHPDPADDVSTLICNGVGFSGDGEVLAGGNIALDPVDRVIVLLARGNSSFEPFRFIDLDATTPSFARPTTPSGELSALKSESKGEPGLLWDPIDGCYVAATRGSGGSPGVFPAQVFRIFKPARSGGFTPATGWSIDLRDADEEEDLPPIGPFSGESFPTVTGKWRWADSLRVGLYLTQPTTGEVWAYIPTGWTDPRL